MPTTSQVEVNKLNLDLNNYRTVPQKDEPDAIRAMISIKPDRFFAVMDSIIEDGYMPTENIIALKDGTISIVKEGNRRIAILKLLHGYIPVKDFNIPSAIVEKINKLSDDWKKENKAVPCTLYTTNEKDKVDKIVNRTHGKGEKAGRDPWNSIARARHNRDFKNASEPGLTLLEKYLKEGNNINNAQKERWGGDYPITVLDEAIRKIHSRLNFVSSIELATAYPKITKRNELEDILLNIGLDQITFEIIRSSKDYATEYGIPPIAVNPTPATSSTLPTNNSSGPASSTSTTASQSNSSQQTNTNQSQTNSQNTSSTSGSSAATTSSAASTTSTATKAHATNDPKHVASLLKKFNPKGNNRQKVVDLRDELKRLKIKDNPIAFCLLLRSMFEISAKAYGVDNGIKLTRSDGKERTLVDLLDAISKHITGNNSKLPMQKVLHGALTEIAKPHGILSVTSMNQLVHNPNFSIISSDICTTFANIFPLLEAMN